MRPDPSEEHRAFYFDREPNCSVHYSADGTVELVEVFHAEGCNEVLLGDIQLTFRLMDDDQADLERAGLIGRPVDIGQEYDEGFTLWSMASLTPSDLTPGTAYDPDDERRASNKPRTGTSMQRASAARAKTRQGDNEPCPED